MWSRRRCGPTDDEIEEELRFHLEREARDLGPDASRRAFGNSVQVKEATRAMWRVTFRERCGQDARFAARLLRRSPVFALPAVLSLALGVAATGAAFSLADAFLLRPLPVPEPARLPAVNSATPDNPVDGLLPGLLSQ